MSDSPLICGYCPTLNRPKLLARALACWAQQTYSRRWLIVLDDSGQYDHQWSDEEKWEIISVPRRIRSLGEKNNVAISLSPFDAEYLIKIDDDEIYMPWACEASVEALSRGDLCQPRWAFDYVNGEWVKTKTHAEGQSSLDVDFAYHSCWSMRRTFFEKMRGYAPETFAGDDVELDKRRREMKIPSVGLAQKYEPFLFYMSNYYKAHPEELGDAPVNISRRGGLKEHYVNTPVGEYVGKLPKHEGPVIFPSPIPTKTIARKW